MASEELITLKDAIVEGLANYDEFSRCNVGNYEVSDFQEVGLLTSDEGLVIEDTATGAKFHVTIQEQEV